MANASFPFWEPATLWKKRSVGAPWRTASIWVLTCARTHIWVGISNFSLISWNLKRIFLTLSTVSSTGFRPITASPTP